jgi:hypothetical protein
MFIEINNDNIFLEWKIVIIQPIIKERGEPKNCTEILCLLICDKLFPEFWLED